MRNKQAASPSDIPKSEVQKLTKSQLSAPQCPDAKEVTASMQLGPQAVSKMKSHESKYLSGKGNPGGLNFASLYHTLPIWPRIFMDFHGFSWVILT